MSVTLSETEAECLAKVLQAASGTKSCIVRELGGKKSTRKCSSDAASGTNGKTATTTRMPFTERIRARWTSGLPKQSN